MTRLKVNRDLYAPIIKAVIVLFVLWIIGIIFKGLPMLKDLTIPKVYFTAPDVVDMIIASLMIIVLINFANELGSKLRKLAIRFPESGTLTTSLVYAIAVLILYNAFTPLGNFLFDENFWVYQLGFLILLFVPVGFGGTLLYKNADYIIDLITGEVEKTTSEEDEVVCQECNTPNEPKAKFCVNCGTEIILPKEKTKDLVCQECGADNDQKAKFCFQCGAEMMAPLEQEKAKICTECGEENEHDAGFCIECGTRLV